MAAGGKSFEAHIKLFPPKYRRVLHAKLAYKKFLETGDSLRIPPRIWLAFLTPADLEALAYLPKKRRSVAELKKAVLETFSHPRLFLDTRNPFDRSSDRVTLALLEILYDLEERKILLPQKRYREWLEVANHFGLWKLRYVLEDLEFRTFDPENFALFKSVVERQLFVEKHLVASTRGILEEAFKRAGLTGFAIKNRRKNIYGIYKKMALRKKSINEIFDVHGFRILMASTKDCYRAIEVLHHLWPPFPERFKDYLIDPKPNGYQSIHTVLSALEKRPTEFQVRTYEMDVIAESGPANHAEYKKSSGAIT